MAHGLGEFLWIKIILCDHQVSLDANQLNLNLTKPTQGKLHTRCNFYLPYLPYR